MEQTLKELRKSLKLTQEGFANQLGVSQSRIASAEKGDMSDELSDKIYQKFKVKVITLNNPAKSPTDEMLLKIEQMWKDEIIFLRNQLEAKDKMINALTEKFLKFKVSNQPLSRPKRSNRVGNQSLPIAA